MPRPPSPKIPAHIAYEHAAKPSGGPVRERHDEWDARDRASYWRDIPPHSRDKVVRQAFDKMADQLGCKPGVLWRMLFNAASAQNLPTPVDASTMTSAEKLEHVRRRREDLPVLMAEIAYIATQRELDMLQHDPNVTLRDVVGARTRAIHDLMLVTGEATDRIDVTAMSTAERQAAILQRLALVASSDEVDDGGDAPDEESAAS